jgi:glutamate-5-semialdehyde dehydrogenase
MKTILSIENRNAVLIRMATLLEQERANLKGINQQDLNNYSGILAMEKRLLVDDMKIDGMILSLQQVKKIQLVKYVLISRMTMDLK